MGEGRRRSGIRQVVRRHVDCLHGGDRAAARGGDALLQRAHFARKRRLIAHGRGHTPEQRGDLAARLHKTENIIDKEQHVLVFFVAEVFRHRQAGKRDAHAHAGRFVHLAEDQRRLFRHAALMHFVPKVVTLAGAFAHAREDGIAAVLHGDVVDQLLDEHGLAHAGAAEQADLAALGIGLEQVDDLDAGFEDLNGRVLLFKGRRLAVNLPALRLRVHGVAAVDRLADHVEHAPERAGTDRHRDAAAVRLHGHTAGQTLAARQHNAAHAVAADMLRDLHHKRVPALLHGQRLFDLRQLFCFVKRHIHNGARNLHDLARHMPLPPLLRFCAFAPAEISVISCVTAFWRRWLYSSVSVSISCCAF